MFGGSGESREAYFLRNRVSRLSPPLPKPRLRLGDPATHLVQGRHRLHTLWQFMGPDER